MDDETFSWIMDDLSAEPQPASSGKKPSSSFGNKPPKPSSGRNRILAQSSSLSAGKVVEPKRKRKCPWPSNLEQASGSIVSSKLRNRKVIKVSSCTENDEKKTKYHYLHVKPEKGSKRGKRMLITEHNAGKLSRCPPNKTIPLKSIVKIDTDYVIRASQCSKTRNVKSKENPDELVSKKIVYYYIHSSDGKRRDRVSKRTYLAVKRALKETNKRTSITVGVGKKKKTKVVPIVSGKDIEATSLKHKKKVAPKKKATPAPKKKVAPKKKAIQQQPLFPFPFSDLLHGRKKQSQAVEEIRANYINKARR